jgi:hypothetical protein
MLQKVIPAIIDKWPDEDEGRTIWIQQDNAKPHILPNDTEFLKAVAGIDLDIRLMQQPPNSPDMNVLDLCFFRSLQSSTDNSAPKTIKELIENVEQEYNNYEVDKLARSFLTLQSCMIEVMKEGGGIGYKIPHIGKEQLQAKGELPSNLSITSELIADTLALIAEGEAEIEKSDMVKKQLKSAEKQARKAPSSSPRRKKARSLPQVLGETSTVPSSSPWRNKQGPLLNKSPEKASTVPSSSPWRNKQGPLLNKSPEKASTVPSSSPQRNKQGPLLKSLEKENKIPSSSPRRSKHGPYLKSSEKQARSPPQLPGERKQDPLLKSPKKASTIPSSSPRRKQERSPPQVLGESKNGPLLKSSDKANNKHGY